MTDPDSPQMRSRRGPASMPALWICPACGARLVSRNLWHSCGRYTLETLFAGAAPGVVELARTYVAMLHSLGDVQVIAQKTRLVCVARVRFAGLSPRKRGFLASFALHRWLDSPLATGGPRCRRVAGGAAECRWRVLRHLRYLRRGTRQKIRQSPHVRRPALARRWWT